MHQKLRTALATTAAAALTGGLLAVTAGTASAADPTKTAQADFNNDGKGDVAFSAGNAHVAGKADAGQIVVLYGTASGVSGAKRQTFSQNTTGVPGGAETGDGYGWSSAYGDFNSDGYDDLAVAAEYEDVGTDKDGGTVSVLWGSSTGLKGGTTLSDPAVSSHDNWGSSLAAGDFDGDGRDDLAVGSTSHTFHVFKGGISTTGTAGGRYTVKLPIMSGSATPLINLTAGDVTGDGRTDLVADGFETDSPEGWNANYFVPGTSAGLKATGVKKLKPGVITDIGDINGDGYGDIVSGVEWDAVEGDMAVPNAHKGGQAYITYGSPSGPASVTAVHQDSGSLPGGSETNDSFGGELSLGDVNGDGLLDLAIGAYGENLGGVVDAGSVYVLYGTTSGLSTTGGVQYFTQNTAGVPGSDEKGDFFGSELKLDDVTGDGKADLVVGSIGENSGNGLLTHLPSDGTRITASGARSIGPSDVGISTTGTPVLGGNAAN